MIRRPLFRKTFHGLLSVLYLSLSLYAVTCSFHHDLLTDLHSQHHDDSHHPHEAGGKSSQDSSSDNGLFCKFVQKISGSAVLASVHAVSWLAVSTPEPFFSTLFVPGPVSATHSGRAPPILS